MLDTKNPSVHAVEPTAPSASSKQPVPAAISVSVTGSRASEATGQRELFTEATETVLLLSNGAVVRLSAAAAPGQLLFLSNKKTAREVVCRVVKYKSSSSGGGYAELEFTEAAPGFWDGELRHSGRPLFPTSAEAFKAASNGNARNPAEAAGAQGERASPVSRPDVPAGAPVNFSQKAAVLDEEASQQLLNEPAAQAPHAEESGAEIAFLQQQLESLLSGKPPASLSHRAETQLPPPDTSAVANALLKILDTAKGASPPNGEATTEQSITPAPSAGSVANQLFAEADAPESPAREGLEPDGRDEPTASSLDFQEERTNALPPRPHYVPPSSSRSVSKVLLAGAVAAGIIAATGISWYSRRAQADSAAEISAYARAAAESAKKAARSMAPRKNSGPNKSTQPKEQTAALGQKPSEKTGADSATKDLHAEAAAELQSLKETASKTRTASEPALPQSEPAIADSASRPEPEEMQPAKVLKTVRAVAPPEATREYVSGNVTIDAVVDRTGHVTKMKVLSGPEVLRKAAMAALKEWQYQPATIKGKPTASHVIERIQFWYEP